MRPSEKSTKWNERLGNNLYLFKINKYFNILKYFKYFKYLFKIKVYMLVGIK